MRGRRISEGEADPGALGHSKSFVLASLGLSRFPGLQICGAEKQWPYIIEVVDGY